MKKALFIVFLLGALLKLGAQDLIVERGGNRIYCRIIRVDSSSITYKTPHVREDLVIDRQLVETYYQSKSAARPAPESTSQSATAPADVILFKFRYGGAKPLSEFANMDVNDEQAGLARGGKAVEGTAIVKLHKIVGLSLGYKFQSNPFNVEAVCNDLRAYFTGATFSGNAEDWKMKGLFTGLHLTFPLHQPEGLTITADMVAGIPNFVFPVITIVGDPGGMPVTVNQSATDVSTTAVSAGLGFRYNLSKLVAFDLNFDYLTAKPVFRVATSNNYGAYEVDTYEQKFKTFNITGGICFCFQKKK